MVYTDAGTDIDKSPAAVVSPWRVKFEESMNVTAVPIATVLLSFKTRTRTLYEGPDGIWPNPDDPDKKTMLKPNSTTRLKFVRFIICRLLKNEVSGKT